MNWRKSLYEKMEGVVPEIELLEELHDATDQEAGDREWYWADKFGYSRGLHYALTMRAVSARGKIGGKIGGAITGPKMFELGTGIFAMSEEEKYKARSKGNLGRTSEQNLEIGRNAVRRMNEILGPEGRLEASRKGGRARMAEMSLQERIDQARRAGKLGGAKGGAKGGPARLGRAGCQRRVRCPYCEIEGPLPTLKRWHFDNCPKKSRIVFVREAP